MTRRGMVPRAARGGVLLLVLAVAGCLSFGPGEEARVVYYEIGASPSPWSGGSLDGVIALKAFTSSEALEHEGVRYRSSDVESGYWVDDRWAQSVATMVRGVVQREFESAGLFRRVGLMDTAGFADYLMDGAVHQCEEEDRGGEWFAVLELTIEVSRGRDGSVVYHRRFREEEPCGDRTVREVVRALSRAMTRVVEQLRTDLKSTVGRGE